MSDITKQVGSLHAALCELADMEPDAMRRAAYLEAAGHIKAAKDILKRNPITDDMRKRDRITADLVREQREYIRTQTEREQRMISSIKRMRDISNRNGIIDGGDSVDMLAEGSDKMNRWPLWVIMAGLCRMSPNAYAAGLRYAYTTGQGCSDAVSYFHNAHKGYLMNAAERNIFEGLTPETVIYRGADAREVDGGIYGYSWTMCREVAEWFAFSRGLRNRCVISVKVGDCEPLAYLNDRDGFEIIAAVPGGCVELVTRVPTEYYSRSMDEHGNLKMP